MVAKAFQKEKLLKYGNDTPKGFWEQLTEAFNNFKIEFDNLEIGDFEKESLDNSELALNEVTISTNFKPTKKICGNEIEQNL